jgi:hypothetical protein
MEAVLRLTRSPLGPVAIMLNDLRGSDRSAGEGRPLRLHVEFTGTPAALARKTDDAQRYCRDAGAAETAVLDEGGAAAWTGMREHPRTLGTPEGLRLKVALPVTAVASVLDVVQERATAADLRCWAIAFAGNGIIYVYLDGGTPAPYLSIVHELRGRAMASGGSLVIQECPPALKSLVDVWGEPPSGFGVMKSLKATYDPGHHLNPGRYVGGI